jgi:putative transposase
MAARRDSSLLGGCNRHLQKYGPPLAADFFPAAPPPEIVQALQRSLLVPPARSARGLGKVEKVRDIAGRYLNPPDKAVVLCVDEKTQIQALDRTQPLLSMGLGYVEAVTHDYIRHDTTTLFAALDVATGSVIAECKPRHRHQEFLSFLRRIDQEVPPELDVPMIVDNTCTHKHAKVRSWFAQRPGFYVHFTPTYASWLNQVERWFGIITQRAMRRGSFSSV